LPTQPARVIVDKIVASALAEDLGDAGDITTNAIFSPDPRVTAHLVARRPGVLAGLQIGLRAFTLLDPRVSSGALKNDGDRVDAGATIAKVDGAARAILTGERTALNLLCHLSGIATATRALVDCVAGTNARIAATRKTTPGLRVLEKYAVQCGGGETHRFGLYDGILIKDNHIAAAGGIGAAVGAARKFAGHMVKVEVEVDTLDQLAKVLALPDTGRPLVDVVLLDNMDIETLRKAVEMNNGKVLLEASGSVTLETVRAIAETGVDLISSGAITHSAPILDIALDLTR